MSYLLTDKQKTLILILFRQNKSINDIMEHIGCSRPTVHKALKDKGVNSSKPFYTPTQEQIKERSKLVRANWDKNTQLKRSGNMEDDTWMPQTVAMPKFHGKRKDT